MTQEQIIKIIDIRIDLLNALIEENTDSNKYRYNINQVREFAKAELEQLKSSIK